MSLHARSWALVATGDQWMLHVCCTAHCAGPAASSHAIGHGCGSCAHCGFQELVNWTWQFCEQPFFRRVRVICDFGSRPFSLVHMVSGAHVP